MEPCGALMTSAQDEEQTVDCYLCVISYEKFYVVLGCHRSTVSVVVLCLLYVWLYWLNRMIFVGGSVVEYSGTGL